MHQVLWTDCRSGISFNVAVPHEYEIMTGFIHGRGGTSPLQVYLSVGFQAVKIDE
jgi:hypothetical protein